MEIDPKVDIRPFLDVDADVVDIIEAKVVVPSGWDGLIQTIEDLVVLIERTNLSATVTKVRITNGVLKIKYECDAYFELWNAMLKGIALESTKTCMVCGGKGQRRKAEEHSPVLCRTHYIQYVNFLGAQQSV